MRVWRGTQLVFVAFVLLALSGCALLGIAPSITVLQGSTEIKPSDSFDFGTVYLGGSVSVDFTVKNTGTWELDLSGQSAVQISGPDASDFTLDSVPAAVITPGSSGDLSVTFKPSASGSRAADVTITAADGTTLTFTLAGLCLLG